MYLLAHKLRLRYTYSILRQNSQNECKNPYKHFLKLLLKTSFFELWHYCCRRAIYSNKKKQRYCNNHNNNRYYTYTLFSLFIILVFIVAFWYLFEKLYPNLYWKCENIICPRYGGNVFFFIMDICFIQ